MQSSPPPLIEQEDSMHHFRLSTLERQSENEAHQSTHLALSTPRRLSTTSHPRSSSAAQEESLAEARAVNSGSPLDNRSAASTDLMPFNESYLFGFHERTKSNRLSLSEPSASIPDFSYPFGPMRSAHEDNAISEQKYSITSMLSPFKWASLPHTLQHMELNLFRPRVTAEPTENDTFLLEDLAPLSQFRQLRTLKIVGMLDSYQMYIWETAWSCPHLEVLTLEMCLEPSIRKTRSREWPTIQGDWKMKKPSEEKKYHGYKGHGQLNHDIGYGELLDSLSIGLAHHRAKKHGLVNDRLSIVALSLTSFVVDAEPFAKWFDPMKLKALNFAGFCVDAGFSLPLEMQKVKIAMPSGAIPRVVKAHAYPTSSAKLVVIRKTKEGETSEVSGGGNAEGKYREEEETTMERSGTSTSALDTPEGATDEEVANLTIPDEFERGLKPSVYPPLVGQAAKMEAALQRRAQEAQEKKKKKKQKKELGKRTRDSRLNG